MKSTAGGVGVGECEFARWPLGIGRTWYVVCEGFGNVLRDIAPACRGPVLRYETLSLVALCEGDRIEETLATENEREVLKRASAHVHPDHAAHCCWSTASSPLPARSANWLDGPCLAICSMYLGGNSCLDL